MDLQIDEILVLVRRALEVYQVLSPLHKELGVEEEAMKDLLFCCLFCTCIALRCIFRSLSFTLIIVFYQIRIIIRLIQYLKSFLPLLCLLKIRSI